MARKLTRLGHEWATVLWTPSVAISDLRSIADDCEMFMILTQDIHILIKCHGD